LADSVVPGADPIFESKYSGSEAEINGLSIYDPGAEHGRQAQSSDHAMLSLGIRNFKVGMPLATPSMGLKGVASALPRSSLDSIAGSMIT
nr:hypothetical protein [Tanacetum cinerariifolium]